MGIKEYQKRVFADIVYALSNDRHIRLLPYHRFKEELGFDDEEFIELMKETEYRFEIRISEHKISSIKTVAQAYQMLGELL